MCHKRVLKSIFNNHGIGLVAAIFVIIIMAMFGLLIARYISTGTTASLDDYQWTQALYSAESGAKLQILFHDNGGNWGVGPWVNPVIEQFNTSNVDGFNGIGNASTLKTQANHPSLTISREITIKYIL